MTIKGGGTAFGKPPKPRPPTLAQRLQRLRHQPSKLAGLAVVVVLGGYAWMNRGTDSWITVAPAEMRLAVGASQELTVAFTYKPRFLMRFMARPAAGTIQLISFPSAVDVAPTTIVTTGDAPQAKLKVTGLREGGEELILAASNRPTDERSWQTTSVRVVVGR
jgi:hypothetical protein